MVITYTISKSNNVYMIRIRSKRKNKFVQFFPYANASVLKT